MKKNHVEYNRCFYASVLFFMVFMTACIHRTTPQDDSYKLLREKMVIEQIEARGITDAKVLTAMRKVERHRFVPENLVKFAYEDHPLPIGYGQTISQPYIVAFMTETLQPGKNDKVLEIGTGSGYQAAILAEICDSVFSIEIVEELGIASEKLLKSLGYSNVKVKAGDGYNGWTEHSPFDAIIVTCAPTHVPVPLVKQLKEGGKMIVPVGGREVQQLVLLKKSRGKLIQQSVLPVRFVPMVDEKHQTY
ncbi:MAG: protein-L-isoaspartate(D-aspartate) O-methyltransferase [Bacteroidales bacterium]|nr:protein-L-isoaspartate(D-aspartate) O-methyltransferase [Bacteroidales bacterium]